MSELDDKFEKYLKADRLKAKIQLLIQEFEEMAESGDYTASDLDEFTIEFGEDIKVRYESDVGWSSCDNDSEAWSGSNSCSY